MNEEYELELAAHVSGVGDDAGYDAIDAALFEKFQVSIEEFSDIAHSLLPMIDVGKSTLTGKTYKGFANDGMFFLKTEI